MAASTTALVTNRDASASLRSIQPAGWSSGYTNLLRHELRPWLKTRFGLIQAAVWLLALNGFMALPLWIAPLLDPAERNLQIRGSEGGPFEMGIAVFFRVGVQICGVGVAILAMGALVGEKKSGTAAWVLSKPASRSAFVLAKLTALGLGIAAVMVGLQAALAYLQIGVVSGQWAAPMSFVTGSALLGVYALFALAFTVMLGALLSSRGAVAGVSLGVLFGQQMVAGVLGPVAAYLPVNLGTLATAVALGQPMTSFGALASTAILALVCVGVAIWRFGREEL